MAGAWNSKAMMMQYKAGDMSHTTQGSLELHPVSNERSWRRSELRRHGRFENLKACSS